MSKLKEDPPRKKEKNMMRKLYRCLGLVLQSKGQGKKNAILFDVEWIQLRTETLLCPCLCLCALIYFSGLNWLLFLFNPCSKHGISLYTLASAWMFGEQHNKKEEILCMTCPNSKRLKGQKVYEAFLCRFLGVSHYAVRPDSLERNGD